MALRSETIEAYDGNTEYSEMNCRMCMLELNLLFVHVECNYDLSFEASTAVNIQIVVTPCSVVSGWH
jgi:hypothetical protein